MVVILCVPSYYAIDLGGLPQISIRRIATVPLIILYLLYFSTSAQARGRLVWAIRNVRVILIGVIGFFVMIFLSILTSITPPASISDAANALLTWFLPFFAAVSVCKTDRDIMFLVRTVAVCAIFVGIVGIVEVPLQQNLMVRIMPASMYENMLRDQSFVHMLAPQYRNWQYRAPSVFGVSLSFGEFEAFIAPLGAFFLLSGQGVRDRTLGFIVLVTGLLGVWASGARGANLSLVVAVVVFVGLWILRERKVNPFGLLAPTMMAMAVVAFMAVFGLTMVSQRAHDLILGQDDPLSTQARLNQWELAKPKILENPVTGHGLGTGGDVLGYGDPDLLSVDSYPISLMIETGVPSLVFFLMMVGGAIWVSARASLVDLSQRGAMSAGFASALAAFATYRIALSQRENHSLVFVVCGVIVAGAALSSEASATRKSKFARSLPQGSARRSKQEHRV